MTAGYSGKPLPAKLGVKGSSRVLVIAAPDGFDLGAPHHKTEDLLAGSSIRTEDLLAGANADAAGREPYDIVLL